MVRASQKNLGGWFVAALISSMAASVSLSAADVTWDGGGGNLGWATATNWSGDALPVANDTIIFSGAVAGGSTISMSGATQFGGSSNTTTVNFNNAAGFTIGTIPGYTYWKTINVQDANTYTLTSNGALAMINNTSGMTVDVTTGGTLAISGGLTVGSFGTGWLFKQGDGVLALSGGRPANASVVDTIIRGGVLSVASFNDLGTGFLAVQGGTFRYTGVGAETKSGAVQFNLATATVDVTQATGDVILAITSGDLSEGTSFTKAGPGRLELSATVPLSGNAFGVKPVIVGGGTLSLDAGAANVVWRFQSTVTGAAGTLIQVSGTGNVRNDSLTANWSGNLAALEVESGGTFDIRGNQVTVAALTGSGSVINSYYLADSGIRGETITVGADNGSGTFSGVISGSVTTSTQPNARISLVKAGTGTQTLSGANTFTGSTAVSGGTLELANALALQNSPLNTTGAGTVALAAGITAPTLGGLSGAVNLATKFSGFASMTGLTLNPATGVTATYSGVVGDGAGGLAVTKTGPGIQVLSGTNTFTGAVAVNAGTLRASSGAALGTTAGSTTVNSGGTLDINGVDLGSEPVILAGGSLVNNGVQQVQALRNLTVTASSTIGGSGRWDVRGTGSTTTVNAGATLTKVNTNLLYLGVLGTTLVNNGEIVVDAGTIATYNTTISGAGSFRVNNGRTLSLEAGSLNPLAVTLNGGTLFTDSTQSGGVTVADATTNRFTGGGNATLSGTLTGSGRLDLVHSGVATIYLSGNNSGFTGTVGIDNTTGNVYFNAASAASAAAAYEFSGTSGGAYAARSNAAGSLTYRLGSLSGTAGVLGNALAGSTATFSIGGLNTDTTFGGLIENGSGTTALVKEGTGSLTLSGANTFAGGTTISAGTLVAAAADTLGIAGTISIGASGTFAVADSVSFSRPLAITSGGRVRAGNGSSVILPDAAALAAWESTSPLAKATAAEILYGNGGIGGSRTLASEWFANPGDNAASDILDLAGTGANTTWVLSLTYDAGVADPSLLNIVSRPGTTGAFAAVGQGSPTLGAWTSSFATPGQYGIDTSSQSVWVVTDTNSQFTVVAVPEPGSLPVAGLGVAAAGLMLRRRARRV